MGACTSRHEVLKNAGESPLPALASDEDEAVVTAKKEDMPLAGVAEEGGKAKLPPLESKNEKSSSECTPERVKQDDINPQESVEVVEKSGKIEALGTTEKEVAKTEATSEIENKNANAYETEAPQTKKEAAKTVLEKPIEETPKPVEETQKPETSPAEAEEEKSKTDTTEAKTVEEKKTTPGSDDKKPLFKLWF